MIFMVKSSTKPAPSPQRPEGRPLERRLERHLDRLERHGATSALGKWWKVKVVEKSGEVYHQQIRTNHGISWDINGKKLEIEDDLIMNSGTEVEFGNSIDSWKLTNISIGMVMLSPCEFWPWAVEHWVKSGFKRSGLPGSSTKGHESEIDIMIGN